MRFALKSALAVLSVTALAGGAIAAERAVHVTEVALPDGGIARVHYVGDHPPAIRFVPVRMMTMPAFAPDDVDAMFAAMDAQTDAMMRQAALIANAAPQPGMMLQQAKAGGAPATGVHYSYVSSTTTNGCTQTVRMTSDGGSAQPQVLRTSAGSCDGAKMQPAATEAATPEVVPAVATETKPKPVPADTI